MKKRGRIQKYIQPYPRVGQTWHDYNCTRNRKVLILDIDYPIVTIKNIENGRVSHANIKRFNGVSKGYKSFDTINPEWLKRHKNK